jgi:four helix bundle protein
MENGIGGGMVLLSRIKKKEERRGGENMNYPEWILTVPSEITKDPIWKMEVYRLALFAGDIGWQDAQVLIKEKLMWGVADQLHGVLNSISANLTEGYSRSKGLDRAHFIEYSLGSAREGRDWYYKSRHVLKDKVVSHRIGLTTHIIGMLTPMVSHQRKNAIREESSQYKIPVPSIFSIDSEVPFP